MEPSLESTPLGRYRLIALLGQGGMADVYLACTTGPGGFQKLLVVKLARFTGDPLFSQMFLNEARLAAQLSHPNIVQTYEIGEEGTRHYIVMEYLDGANFARLRFRARKRGGVPPRMAIQILCQVLEGLEYAHQARGIDGRPLSVVHRDLTPTNVVITAHGEVKILDFGIAKAADSHSFTAMGKYSGKLQYMPPEQLRAESIDARADIFSVGVILAETHLGARYWGDAPMPMIAKQLAEGTLPPLPDDMPFALREICARALSPLRDERYPSAAAFKSDLTRYLASLGGPVEREELAAFVCAMCQDDRARLQEVVDAQLARKSSLSLGTAPAGDVPRLERTPVASIYDETSIDEPEVVIERPVEPPSPVAVERSARAPLGWIVAVAVLAAAAVAAVIVLKHGGEVSAPPPAPAVAQPAPPAPPAPTARLEIIASPGDAVLALDGIQLGTNPFVATLPRDGHAHEVTVSAAGYLPGARRFTLDSDLLLQLTLEKQPAPVAAVPLPGRSRVKAIAAAPPPPPPPPVQPATVLPPAEAKRSLDHDPYKSTTKRTLDSDVYIDHAKQKPALDRDNPYGKSN